MLTMVNSNAIFPPKAPEEISMNKVPKRQVAWLNFPFIILVVHLKSKFSFQSLIPHDYFLSI